MSEMTADKKMMKGNYKFFCLLKEWVAAHGLITNHYNVVQ